VSVNCQWIANQKDSGFLLEGDVDLKLTGKVALVTGSTAGIEKSMNALAERYGVLYLIN